MAGNRITKQSRLDLSTNAIARRFTRRSLLGRTFLPQVSGRVAPVIMPLISRGLPAYDSGGFGGAYAAGNAVDSDYSTAWRSVNVPSSGSPQWWALDISTIPNAQKSSAILHWFNDSSLSYWDNVSAQTSGNFNTLMRDYTLRASAAAGGGAAPAVGDASWVTLATVAGNVYRSRQHGLNLSGYNWVGFRITSANGATGVNDDVAAQVNIHNIAGGNQDNILFLGDSIMSECMSWRNLDGTPWVGGPLSKQIETARSGRYPLYQNGGVPTTRSDYADTNKAVLAANFTGKYVVLGWGANDSSAATSKATFKANMLSVANYCIAQGRIVIIPKVTKRTLDATADGYVVQYNAAIDELHAADPTHILIGPDFYAAVSAGTIPLRDGLHPTYSGAGNGYQQMQGLWASWLLANIY